MKCYGIFFLILVSLLAIGEAFIDNLPKHNEKIQENIYRSVDSALKKLNLDKLESIDRVTFTKVLTVVLTKDHVVPEHEMENLKKIETVLEKELPESIPVKDIKNYFEVSFLTKVISETIDRDKLKRDL